MTGNYNFETGSMTSIIEQLGRESLHKRRKGSKLILLFQGLKGRASIPCNDLQPPNRRSRNQHLLCFRHLSESRFLLDALHRRSKFANFCHDLMQNHLS